MKLKVIKGEDTYNVNIDPEKNLLGNLIDNNIKISAPCNGNGTCGKCKVQLLNGNIHEKDVGNIKLNENQYLACKTYIKSDCIIKISDTETKKFSILEDFKKNKINPDCEFKKIALKIDENFLTGKSLTDTVNLKMSTKFKFTLEALKKLSTLINESSEKQSKYSLYKSDEINMICNKNVIIDVFNSKDESNIYGIAIDVGTTTIAMKLVNMETGKILSSTSILNSQRQFGADVISRIQYSMEKSLKNVSNSVKEDIIEGIEKLLRSSKINKKNVYEVAISGNNIMQHLLMELFCDSMAVYPFTAVTNDILEVGFYELFKNRLLNCKVVILPSISSYVGADIVSGMAACKFYNLEHTCLFIDIGTNGEMALGNKDKIVCTSTAAGPAFEGANIESGIGSIEGAINSINIDTEIKNGNKNYIINYKTIGDAPAIGICGSGIIDITAELLKSGIIDSTGKFDRNNWKGKFIDLTLSDEYGQKVVFTQKDIREIQVAKSAIRSGIEILMRKFGCHYEDLYKVYIAGGFGNELNLKNAAVIGLIPKQLLNKIKIVGNSSLSGTIEYIINKNTKQNMKHIIDIAQGIDISMNDDFNSEFINNMSF